MIPIRTDARLVPPEALFPASDQEASFKILSGVVLKDQEVFLRSSDDQRVLFHRDNCSPVTRGTSRRSVLKCRDYLFDISKEKNFGLEGDVSLQVKGLWEEFWTARKGKSITSLVGVQEFIELLASLETVEPPLKRSKGNDPVMSVLLELQHEVRMIRTKLDKLTRLTDISLEGDDAVSEENIQEPELKEVLLGRFGDVVGEFFEVSEIAAWDEVQHHSQLSALDEVLQTMQSSGQIAGFGVLYGLPGKRK